MEYMLNINDLYANVKLLALRTTRLKKDDNPIELLGFVDSLS